MSEMVQRSPQQQLIQAVRSEQFGEQVAMALPPTVTPQRFVRVATTAIMANPDIAKLEHNSVLRAMVQAAADGLMPDGREAAIINRGGKASYTPMIGGFRKIAAEHGWTLKTAVVYQNDEFRHAVVDGEESINHAPVRPGAERGPLIAAYAIAKHRDGRKLITVLHPDDVANRQRMATTQAVWDKWPAAMWEKSAGRDLFSQLGLAEELVARVLRASETDPDEATTLIYGGSHDATVPESAGELPAADIAGPPHAAASPPPPGAERVHPGDVDSQQAAAAAQTPSPSPAAAPGEPEPSLADEQLFVAPPGTDDDPAVAAARQASLYQVPNGDNRGLTLAQVQEKGAPGSRWLKWALANITDPAEYRQAVWAFCRVYEPELYQAALAASEAA